MTWRYHRTSLSSKRTKPMLTYHQITAAERYTLGLLRRRGLHAAAIARILGRHRSTIGREVRRNGTPATGAIGRSSPTGMRAADDPAPDATRGSRRPTGCRSRSCSGKIGAPSR